MNDKAVGLLDALIKHGIHYEACRDVTDEYDMALNIIRSVYDTPEASDLPKYACPEGWVPPFEVDSQDRMGGVVYFILDGNGKVWSGRGWRESEATFLCAALNLVTQGVK